MCARICLQATLVRPGGWHSCARQGRQEESTILYGNSDGIGEFIAMAQAGFDGPWSCSSFFSFSLVLLFV